jgi:hypothetical protein
MHIYAFGSVCRGEIAPSSDVDLLLLGIERDSDIDPDVYSVYSYERIRELWREGNPFAWHLSLESRLLFSSDKTDYLGTLGSPEAYKHCMRDCEGFLKLFCEARASIEDGAGSTVFDLSTIFLSMRNIATCFSLGVTRQPNFSRSSALRLGANSVPLAQESYLILERSRILCTRGLGVNVTTQEVGTVMRDLDQLHEWMRRLVEKAGEYERV